MCKIALSATRDSDILSCNVRWLRSDDRKMPESLELSKQVCIFAAENQKDSMNGDNTERIPQESECQNETEYGAYWKEHPLSRSESLRRLKLLREERRAKQTNW